MAIYGNTFDAFTIVFATLSLVFTIAATGGDFWVTYGKFGDVKGELGLWEACRGTGKLKQCTPYTDINHGHIPGNKIISLTVEREFSTIIKGYQRYCYSM